MLKTHQNAANMIEKSVQPVYKMMGLQDTLAAEGGDTAVLKRLNVIDQARGMLNSIAVDMDGEDYAFQTFQLSGTQEILESTYNLLSAVTCIPQTILFGRSPSGENATGESDLENYYNFVEGIQKRMLKKNIRTLLKAVTQAGVYDGSIEDPGTIKPTFKPLWSLSEAEQATVELTKAQRAQATAQTAQLYIDMQVLQPDEGGGGSSSKLSSKSMPAKKYVTSDGKMDVDTLRKDYDEFTQEMDEGCRTYLKQSMDSVEFKSAKLTEDSPFGYSPSLDAFCYDTSRKSFHDIDLSVVTTHELAHRIDSHFVNAAENEEFRQKVSDSKQLIDSDPERFQKFCIENDEEGFLSDICSAVCEGDYEFEYGHLPSSWKQEGVKEREIFANYYSLVAFKDNQKLDFLKDNLPEIFDCCDSIKRTLHGEEE